MPTNVLTTHLVQQVTNITVPSRSQLLDSNLIAGLQVLTNHVPDPIWLQVLNSNLVAALIGFLAACLIWKLTEQSQTKRKLIEDEIKYLALLRAIQTELRFYANKLEFLSQQMGNAMVAINTHQPVIQPSYTLYPTFLERAKQELSGFFKSDELVRELGHCHFELCHIVERVNWYKSLTAQLLPANFNNIGGIKRLIDSNIPVFKRVADLFEKEENQIRSNL
jgi:hypothetical protein